MKKMLLWFTAILITVGAAMYQRLTGPSHPLRTRVTVNGIEYKLRLVRSISLDMPSAVKLHISDPSVKARLFIKKFRTNEEYQVTEFQYRTEKEAFYAEVPKQPAAGKIQYYVEITDNSKTTELQKEEPVVIRFKGGVPALVLIPHILIMFVAMLFSNLAGLMSITKHPQYKKYGVWTLILLVAGGMILGPIVQYYAFGDFWTGIPFGWDLTDNKTLLTVAFWIIAVYMNRKSDRPGWIALAALVLLLVYSIPHSLFGSELDYTTGEVIQG